jgi:hypothetical protein
MEASQMLDVVHYFFEEDMRYGSLEGAQLHTSVREQIYGTMYGYDYKYGVGRNRSVGRDGAEAPSVKPYVPATEFDPDSHDPFGGVLEVPIS